MLIMDVDFCRFIVDCDILKEKYTMCKVKFGTALMNESDVQNLIVGIIFRQQEQYKEGDILNLARKYTENSSFKVSTLYLQKMIEENLDFLVRFGRIKCLDGMYFPLSIYDF